jgi:gluconate 2-dehydrogenase gamma chain
MNVQRRTVLQVLAGAGFAQGQEHTHTPEATPRTTPVYFAEAPYKLLTELCERIVPGAREAGVPEFVDLLASENEEYRRQLSGGLMWLDAACADRYGNPFLECAAGDQKTILDEIAFKGDSPGVVFFAFLRDLALDGYFTSRIGIEYLSYRGNGALPEFRGCPPEAPTK